MFPNLNLIVIISQIFKKNAIINQLLEIILITILAKMIVI